MKTENCFDFFLGMLEKGFRLTFSRLQTSNPYK